MQVSHVAMTRPASLLERAVMLEISILTLLLYETGLAASLLERAVMLEISILTLLLCETCIVIRKSSHVRDIDSDSVAICETCIVIRKSSHVRDIDSDSVAMRDLHRY